MSTNTTIGTLDEFANVLRLTTDVTRLPFSTAVSAQAVPPGVPGTPAWTVSIGVGIPGARPAMVVIFSIFWQA